MIILAENTKSYRMTMLLQTLSLRLDLSILLHELWKIPETLRVLRKLRSLNQQLKILSFKVISQGELKHVTKSLPINKSTFLVIFHSKMGKLHDILKKLKLCQF